MHWPSPPWQYWLAPQSDELQHGLQSWAQVAAVSSPVHRPSPQTGGMPTCCGGVYPFVLKLKTWRALTTASFCTGALTVKSSVAVAALPDASAASTVTVCVPAASVPTSTEQSAGLCAGEKAQVCFRTFTPPLVNQILSD